MAIALFAFLAVFLLAGSLGLLLFYRGALTERLSTVIAPKPERNWTEWLKPGQAGTSLRAVVQPFEKVLPKSPKEVSVIEKRLIRAGYRDESAVRMFYGSKVLVPLFLAVLAFASGLGRGGNAFFAYAVALGVGFLLPDFWLGHKIKSRQLEIRLQLPDFLDLCVVCIEAGLSLDHALARSVEELKVSAPEISDELSLVILEQRAGRPRPDAWRNLAERVDIDVMRALAASINQADQFGTSVAKILRVQSETLRVHRRQSVEEQAAKTAVKLVFPLVLFIFPSIFVVTVGSAVIIMAESFAKYFK